LWGAGIFWKQLWWQKAKASKEYGIELFDDPDEEDLEEQVMENWKLKTSQQGLERREDAGAGVDQAAPAHGAPAAIASKDGAGPGGQGAAAGGGGGKGEMEKARDVNPADSMAAADQHGVGAAAAGGEGSERDKTPPLWGGESERAAGAGAAMSVSASGAEEEARGGSAAGLDDAGVDDDRGKREQRQASKRKRPAAAGAVGRALDCMALTTCE